MSESPTATEPEAPIAPADDIQPEETEAAAAEDAEEKAPTSSLADLLNDETAADAFKHPAMQKLVQQESQKAADRARNQLQAEQRRQYGQPEVMEGLIFGILGEAGLDRESITRSMRDRVANALSTNRRVEAESLAEAIPRVFFSKYDLPREALSSYQELQSSGDIDGAFQTLIDAAVAQKSSELEGSFEKRVKDEAGKRTKAELAAANRNGGTAIPAAQRGNAAGSGSTSLTTAEIAQLPSSSWVRLPDEIKEQIKANVYEADRQRGNDTVDVGRIQAVQTLIRR